MEIVLFELGNWRCGLSVPVVREILRAATVVPLPKAPAVILGVINLRGVIIPVFDIRLRFGLPTKTVLPSDYFIVVKAGQRLAALWVDGVLDVAQLAEHAVKNIQELTPHAEYVTGVAKLADGLVLLYDLEAFLSAAEANQLEEALLSMDDKASWTDIGGAGI